MASANTSRKQSLEASMTILRGAEPTVAKDTFRCDLAAALNWYNSNWDAKDYRKAAERYVLKTMGMKDAAYSLSKATDLEIRQIGALGRLIDRGQHVELDYVERMFQRVEELKTKYVDPQTVAPAAGVAVVSVQDRVMEAARTLAAEVDGAIDDYVRQGTKFSMKNFLMANQVSGVVAKNIGSFYQPLLKELDEAVAGKCAQLEEGYGHLTTRALKQFADFVRQIIADCGQRVVTAKAQRKPRARKAKPASAIVSKMKYMKQFDELKLKSITADKIVGASELWVYNTANRKLIVYYAADGGHLNVSGMSITNYDIEKSCAKTIRDPAKFFAGLKSTGKRAMANVWKAVRAKQSSPRSRINEDMVLLAAN